MTGSQISAEALWPQPMTSAEGTCASNSQGFMPTSTKCGATFSKLKSQPFSGAWMLTQTMTSLFCSASFL